MISPHYVAYIGYAAAMLSTVNQLPQAIKVLRTGDTRSISVYTYTIVVVAVLLWLVYGVLLGDGPLIWANAIALLPLNYILVIKIINLAKGTDRRGL